MDFFQQPGWLLMGSRSMILRLFLFSYYFYLIFQNHKTFEQRPTAGSVQGVIAERTEGNWAFRHHKYSGGVGGKDVKRPEYFLLHLGRILQNQRLSRNDVCLLLGRAPPWRKGSKSGNVPDQDRHLKEDKITQTQNIVMSLDANLDYSKNSSF